MAGVENSIGDCNNIASRAASRALLQSHTYTCAWKIEREKWTAFCPSPIAKNYASKMDSILSFLYTQKTPPTFLKRFALSAPPLDPSGINRVWGSALLSVPPRIPLGSTGYGTSRGGGNLDCFARRYGRKMPKRKTGFELDRSSTACV